MLSSYNDSENDSHDGLLVEKYLKKTVEPNFHFWKGNIKYMNTIVFGVC